MAMMLGDLFQALREAGTSEVQARKASEDVTDFHRRLNRLEILVAMNTTVLGILAPFIVAIFWMVWNINQTVANLG